MATIDRLWLATLTKNEEDAGTDAGGLALTINVDGEDLVDIDFGFMNGSGWLSSGLGPDSPWLEEGQAALSGGTYDSPGEPLTNPIESSVLTNSSIRLGSRSDDAWGPQQVLVLGRAERGVIALAMETDLNHWLSTDSSEGKLTMPVRLVSPGSSSTMIRRVMLLVYTGSGVDVETDSPIELQITAGGNLVLQQQIPDTTQDDLEQYTGNWYFLEAAVPFTRGDVLANGGIRLRILGTDAWVPKSLFVYGLDTAEGRPNEVVHLVSIPTWNLGTLSADTSEGAPSVALPMF
jgi:hypothetical protein